MDKRKLNKLNTSILLFLTVTYLFIAVSHIFYLPPNNLSSSQKHVAANSIFKRRVTDKNQRESPSLKRPDKSTIEEKKKVLDDITQLVSVAFILTYFGESLLSVKPEPSPHNYLLANRQYAYLTLCTFRIWWYLRKPIPGLALFQFHSIAPF